MVRATSTEFGVEVRKTWVLPRVARFDRTGGGVSGSEEKCWDMLISHVSNVSMSGMSCGDALVCDKNLW